MALAAPVRAYLEAASRTGGESCTRRQHDRLSQQAHVLHLPSRTTSQWIGRRRLRGRKNILVAAAAQNDPQSLGSAAPEASSPFGSVADKFLASQAAAAGPVSARMLSVLLQTPTVPIGCARTRAWLLLFSAGRDIPGRTRSTASAAHIRGARALTKPTTLPQVVRCLANVVPPRPRRPRQAGADADTRRRLAPPFSSAASPGAARVAQSLTPPPPSELCRSHPPFQLWLVVLMLLPGKCSLMGKLAFAGRRAARRFADPPSPRPPVWRKSAACVLDSRSRHPHTPPPHPTPTSHRSLTALSVVSLPRTVWRPQLMQLALLCGLLFVFTSIGADGCAADGCRRLLSARPLIPASARRPPALRARKHPMYPPFPSLFLPPPRPREGSRP